VTVIGINAKCVFCVAQRVETHTYDAQDYSDHEYDTVRVQSDKDFKVSTSSHYQRNYHYDHACPTVTKLIPVWLKTDLLLLVREWLSKC
jgi:hypothetical protein